MKTLGAVLLVAGLPLVLLAADAPVPSPGPAVTVSVGSRHGHVTPVRKGFTHTGGGNLDVAQPAPDTLVVTMTGVAVAGGHPCKDSVATLNFDLEQCFEVNFDKPEIKRAKLTLEGRVVGLLRSHCKGGGSAQQGQACAAVRVGTAEILTLCVPPHSVSGGENLSLNCREGPAEVPVIKGKYTLHETFSLSATHPKSLLPCKAASAEFAPDPALDPLWISYWEPFHGASKKDFGFQITLRVAPDADANGK
jgi:hypothetical protein